MGYGAHVDSTEGGEDAPAICTAAVADTDSEDAGRFDNLFMSISSAGRTFYAEERPDQHRIKSVVARRARYVREMYSDWTDNMVDIALGVVLMSTTREANVQEQVHFLYLALGGSYLRSHRGQTFLYEDGAFHLFNGVVPEYMVSRCKEYAECVEGGIWRIGKRGDTSRSESDIFAAMDRAYRSICAPGGGAGVGVDVLSVDVGGEKRGVKRERPWLDAEKGTSASPLSDISDKTVAQELILLTLDMWRTKESKASSASWTDTEALNCQDMIRKIMDQVVKGAIIPYYAEYLDERKDASLGFCLIDACFLYSEEAPRAIGSGLLKQVKKDHSNNIYMHIERRITDPLAETALARMKLFLDQTFYRNKRALGCTMAALSLCFMGRNVGRAFWSIGTGGVGQSLFTSLINSAF